MFTREYFERFARERQYDPLNPSDWYKVAANGCLSDIEVHSPLPPSPPLLFPLLFFRLAVTSFFYYFSVNEMVV